MLELKNYLIKERVAFVKLTDTYDIYDPATGRQVGIAEERPGTLVKFLRLLVNKKLMPTRVDIMPAEDAPPVVSITRGMALFRSTVKVLDRNGAQVGYFVSKFLSIGGGFHVYNNAGIKVAEVKGDWKGWNFTITAVNGQALGQITKKWAGIGKELFTTADNYMIALEGEPDEAKAALLLAAGLAVDVIYKEKQ